MIRLYCDDSATEQCLTELLDRVRRIEGVFLDEGLEIHSNEGYLRVLAREGGRAGKPLVRMPEHALLPLDRVRFGVKDGTLILNSCDADVAPTQRALIDITLELYDVTRKVASHEATCLWPQFAAHRDVLDRLAAGRSDSPIIVEFANLARNGEIEKLVVESFLQTRRLDFGGASKTGRTGKVIMPVIDFIDHDLQAPGYRLTTDAAGNPGVAVLRWQTAARSGECFVRYGNHDAYDTLLYYNFVDASAGFTRSVPLELELRSGPRVKIRSVPQPPFSGALPSHIEDLRSFIPAIFQHTPTLCEFSHILIPAGGHHPGALERLFRFFFVLLWPHLPAQSLAEDARSAERQVIEANREYYEGLGRAIARAREDAVGSGALPLVELMIRTQTANLDAYSGG